MPLHTCNEILKNMVMIHGMEHHPLYLLIGQRYTVFLINPRCVGTENIVVPQIHCFIPNTQAVEVCRMHDMV